MSERSFVSIPESEHSALIHRAVSAQKDAELAAQSAKSQAELDKKDQEMAIMQERTRLQELHRLEKAQLQTEKEKLEKEKLALVHESHAREMKYAMLAAVLAAAAVAAVSRMK